MNEPRNNLPVPFDFTQPLLIEHSVDGAVIPQRPRDGYINATRLCQEAGKLFGDYYRLGQTQAFLKELSLDMGIPISNLVQVIRGRGDAISQGTWVHPQVAINLGQWLSPSFAVKSQPVGFRLDGGQGSGLHARACPAVHDKQSQDPAYSFLHC